jgi:hypothetical protein
MVESRCYEYGLRHSFPHVGRRPLTEMPPLYDHMHMIIVTAPTNPGAEGRGFLSALSRLEIARSPRARKHVYTEFHNDWQRFTCPPDHLGPE